MTAVVFSDADVVVVGCCWTSTNVAPEPLLGLIGTLLLVLVLTVLAAALLLLL